jgi:hypothetical protein
MLRSESVYSQINTSDIDINKEIDRWNSFLSTNEAKIKNSTRDNNLSMSLIGLAKQNLEYLLSLSHHYLVS